MIKKMAAIVALVVTVSLSIAGCTTQTDNTGGQQASHDALLEKMVEAFHNQYLSGNFTLNAWNVTWPNITTVTVQTSTYNRTALITRHEETTYMRFPSTDAATAYLNGYIEGYFLAHTDYGQSGGRIYDTAAGHPPSVFNVYQKTVDSSYYSGHVSSAAQMDDVIGLQEVSVNR